MFSKHNWSFNNHSKMLQHKLFIRTFTVLKYLSDPFDFTSPYYKDIFPVQFKAICSFEPVEILFQALEH